MFASVAMSPAAMLRDFDVVDVNAVLEAESFADVSTSSNAVAEHMSIVI